MTELNKSHWVTEGDNMRLSMPLAKVDKQNRLVSGWATLDNVDTQGDIVTAEASVRAFTRARGNLREMHQPIAVGKVVDFREDEFYDEDDGKFYRGVFVTARVSEGAENTWLKVLDGTLTGFSIGGSIIDSTKEMSKDGQKPVRKIMDFDLVELSLVDNPANQLANFDSISKNILTFNKDANGSVTVGGMLAEMTIENVFICKADSKIVSQVTDSATCPECGLEMESIGWFEQTGNADDRAEKVRETVMKFRTPNNKTGGDEMADEVTKSAEEANAAEVEEVVEDPNTDSLQVHEVPDAVDAEKGEDVEEVSDESEQLSKRIDDLRETLSNILEKKAESHDAAIKALEDKVQSISESFMEKASELENKLDEFGNKLEVEKSRLTDFEKKLEKFNSSEAVRKSAELEKSAEPVQKKTTWDGAFSIDNLR